MSLLQGKVVFLTGGSAGIGLECAKAYVREGATVALMTWKEKEVKEAEKILQSLQFSLTGGESKNEHLAIFGDVSKGQDVKRAIEMTLTKYGRLDAIHNNAGIATPSVPLHETSEEAWDLLFNINLKSILLTTRYGLEAIKAASGCILNTSSLVGEIGQEQHAAYCATKGAINALTKSMALDYAPFGVRVNSLMPAAVWTPMLKRWNLEQQDPAIMESYLNHIHALGYCPEGDVIADAAVFLLSSQSRFITGCNLPVSGGAELGYRALIK